MTVLKVCYKSGAPFNETYHYATHLPMAGAIMGSLGVKKSEIVKVGAALPARVRAETSRRERPVMFREELKK